MSPLERGRGSELKPREAESPEQISHPIYLPPSFAQQVPKAPKWGQGQLVTPSNRVGRGTGTVLGPRTQAGVGKV
jgi:hypothetical protein